MTRALKPSTDEMYRALLDRDPTYDGVFLVGVKTTGIFCRPVCPARKPKLENVEFFASIGLARKAGYRPCKRCAPSGRPDEPPGWVRPLLEAVDRDPAARLADADLLALKIDPARARRYFKEHHGMTFHEYARGRRIGLALDEVRSGADLLDVGASHGFESDSGFRAAFARFFGKPPGQAREDSCLLARRVDTPLGPMLAVANDDGVCLLEFIDRREMEAQVATLRKHFALPVVPGRNVHLDRLTDELARYFAGTLREFSVNLVVPGSAFQSRVWAALRAIPYGRTTSYKAVAATIGAPGASQAVGRANGENRLAIVIPCHRVVRADGHLCGYAGGLRRKEWLLDHERKAAGFGTGFFPEMAQIPEAHTG